jgi:hypothetical protein
MDAYIIARTDSDDACIANVDGIPVHIGPEGAQLLESMPRLSDLLPDEED